MKPFYQVLTIKLLCLVFALSLPEFGFAQSMANARVVDANTDEPLPYATIADLSGSRGTLSNTDGVFALEIKNPTDTISISFLGYQTAILSAEELLTLNEIRLTPEVTQLTDVIVTADDDYLYQIINQCRASVKDAPIEWSRAFLQHVTRSNDQPIEMIQAYYNVSSSQKAIDDLILKNGRVAMAPINGRYFVNLGMTQAITRLDLYSKSRSFNSHPLQLNLRQLRRRYELDRRPSLGNANLYHIAFQPKRKNAAYFSGEIWIDKSTYNLRKIILRDDSLERHPFVSVFPDQEIEYINLELAFTFSMDENSQRLNHLQWNYELNLKPTGRRPTGGLQRLYARISNKVSASGILHCYQYRDLFWEPFFEYSPEHNDYRKISFLPYNLNFWNANHGLVYSEQQLSDMAYFQENGFLMNHADFPSDDEPFFQFNNPHWQADKRVRYKYEEQEGRPNPANNVPMTRFDPWSTIDSEDDIAVQIMLDINRLEDSISFVSSTVLDIFETESEPPYDSLDHCLLNMYFDLCEIERRQMIARIASLDDINFENLKREHEISTQQIRILQRDFFSEVRGARPKRMIKKWNKIIVDNLEIDNLETFKIKLE